MLTANAERMPEEKWVSLRGEIDTKEGHAVLSPENAQRICTELLAIAEQNDVAAPSAITAEPEEPIANVVADFSGEEIRYEPLPMTEVTRRIFAAADNWPRRVGASLFIHTDAVHWLDSTPSLFGWLSQKAGVIDWRRFPGCVSKEETFHELRRASQEYTAVESLPHEPPLANHYYSCGEFPAGDGEAITALVDRFSPDTEEDRWLILAMFATVFWGGKGGSRPAFVVTSQGRGTGKSKITDMVSHLAGGCIELSANEDATIMRSRLLSPEGMNKRIARLDNVKSLKFSWSDLESLITTPSISGKRMYHGEATRPNNLVWLITLNGVALSTDMAQRAVIIRVKKPPRVAAWESETLAFIDEHRQAIIADLLTFLRLPQRPLECRTRWASWERGVLARLNHPDLSAIQDLVTRRANDSDTEQEEIALVEEFFASRLNDLGYEADTQKIHIPSKIAGEWYNAATNERRSIIAATKILAQFIEEGRTIHLKTNPSRKFGRGVLWNGIFDDDAIYDLEEKISYKRNRDNGTGNNWWDR